MTMIKFCISDLQRVAYCGCLGTKHPVADISDYVKLCLVNHNGKFNSLKGIISIELSLHSLPVLEQEYSCINRKCPLA